MTEKRFKLAEDSNGLFSIFDNEDLEDEPLIYGARFGTEKIVDLLNELSEENEQLKKRNKFLEDFDGRAKTVANLKEENEQLKKRLEHYAKVEAMNGDGKNE